jgi:broad specificity phosphatase PhoE
LSFNARLAKCREQLRRAAERLRESRDDDDASFTSCIARETIDFLAQRLKTFQIAADRPTH